VRADEEDDATVLDSTHPLDRNRNALSGRRSTGDEAQDVEVVRLQDQIFDPADLAPVQRDGHARSDRVKLHVFHHPFHILLL
jgi:hypothetical protein